MPATLQPASEVTRTDASYLRGGECRFRASAPSPTTEHRVAIKARSRYHAEHPAYFGGQVFHDFDGMTLAKERLPIDYGHGEAIGYIAGHRITQYGLELDGRLIFDGTPGDLVTSLVERANGGVPYQASIATSPRSKLEVVRYGMTARVNGLTVRGPCEIAREWALRGVAIYPHGADAKTATIFRRHEIATASQDGEPAGLRSIIRFAEQGVRLFGRDRATELGSGDRECRRDHRAAVTDEKHGFQSLIRFGHNGTRLFSKRR